MHAIAHTCAGTHTNMQVSLHVQFIARAKYSIFTFCCIIIIFLERRNFMLKDLSLNIYVTNLKCN